MVDSHTVFVFFIDPRLNKEKEIQRQIVKTNIYKKTRS